MPDCVSLDEACRQGGLCPLDWTRPLLEMVEDPAVSNRDLLRCCQMASRGLNAPERELWMDHLIEFSLWATGALPQRLDLCDHLAREGLARLSSPRRWESFGGLLHIACEAGSPQAIVWALEREPEAVARPGGRLGIGTLHALALNPAASACAAMLLGAGADPLMTSTDGRCALFRCAGNPELAGALIDAGADPLALDRQGHCALGLWIELGDWQSAGAAFSKLGADPDGPLPWGSLAGASLAGPRVDRPLFIAACSPALAASWGGDARSQCMEGLASLGADPLALDARGKTLFERSSLPQALALMEEAALRTQGSGSRRGGLRSL